MQNKTSIEINGLPLGNRPFEFTFGLVEFWEKLEFSPTAPYNKIL